MFAQCSSLFPHRLSRTGALYNLRFKILSPFLNFSNHNSQLTIASRVSLSVIHVRRTHGDSFNHGNTFVHRGEIFGPLASQLVSIFRKVPNYNL
jgi:hypothetical protein